MGKVIDTSAVDKKVNEVFKPSPLAYRRSDALKEKMQVIINEAFDFFKQKDYMIAATYYKSIIIHALEYLSHVKDSTGLVGDVIFDSLTYYSYCLKEIDIDRAEFFRETIDFYVEEEMGFTKEIMKLILDNIDEDDIKYVEIYIFKQLSLYKPGSYNFDKIIKLILAIYNHFKRFDAYFETCKKYGSERPEGYLIAIDMYLSQNNHEEVIKQFQDARLRISDPAWMKKIEARFEEVKNIL